MKTLPCLALFAPIAFAFSIPSLVKRQAGGAVASSEFRRRAYQASAVLDGWVYIDGGEFSYAAGGNVIYQYSSTLLAIDLSQDWTNATVSIQSNSKPVRAPDLAAGGIWVDETNSILYTGFAGRASHFGDGSFKNAGLWSFKPNGQGGGVWTNLNGTADPGFKTEPRPYSALVGSGNGVGYMLGGIALNASAGTDTSTAFTISGLVSYNFTSKQLVNSTVTGISSGGEIQMGGMHFVPNFGSEGILVTFAGDQVGKKVAGSDDFLGTAAVQIYDPSTGKWYEQETTGNIPEQRKEFCMTGAASNNQTYEIFVYAGWNGQLGGAAIPYDEVYVLSLPSFNWFKADYLAENPRHGLTCESIGGGQILTIGGVNTTTNGPDNLYEDVFNTADQFTQGLAVFDLSSMSWKSGYSSSQTSYTPSPEVQQYYATNARTPSFSSSGLSQVFSIQNFNASTTASPNSPSGTGSSSSSSASSSSHKKSSTDTGAIAGGVVGGVLGLALIVGVAIFFFRRRKNKANNAGFNSEMPAEGNQKHELMDTSQVGSPVPVKGERYAKHDNAPQIEMPADEVRHELA